MNSPMKTEPTSGRITPDFDTVSFDYLYEEAGRFRIELLVSYVSRFPAYRDRLIELIADRMVMESPERYVDTDDVEQDVSDHIQWLNDQINAAVSAAPELARRAEGSEG